MMWLLCRAIDFSCWRKESPKVHFPGQGRSYPEIGSATDPFPSRDRNGAYYSSRSASIGSNRAARRAGK
jgi:hypothetical protein